MFTQNKQQPLILHDRKEIILVLEIRFCTHNFSYKKSIYSNDS